MLVLTLAHMGQTSVVSLKNVTKVVWYVLALKNHLFHAFEGFQFNLNDIEPIS